MAAPAPTPAADAGGDLYRAAPKVYPREVDGRFQRLRNLAVFVLLGLFYLVPWVNWTGRQAVLFDLPARKFHILGLTFFPQDFFYLSWLLILAGLALFFFTALAGRLWCGYACPQTVWTEVFLRIERWIEGDRLRRMKLDAAPWSAEKLARKGAKQAIWITFALWTGFTFVGFFTPIRDLGPRALSLSLGPWETFWSLFYAFATYGNAGYLREQVCKYMCPYARFQGAMFDPATLIIAYDPARGEPRGSRRKGSDYRAAGLGDCIDCTLCVQACPTGIDIRDGLQIECIACGACIDACDSVMEKVGYPRGLIRYATEESLAGRRTRILRPRVVIYGLLLFGGFAGFAWSVSHRVPLLVDVVRDRNALYRVVEDGAIENAYTLKIMNKGDAARRYRVTLDDADEIRFAGGGESLEVEVAPGEVLAVPVTLRAPAGEVTGRHEVEFEVEAVDDEDVKYEAESRFFGPMP
ncbi:MAG TPA: cytochrome c oxidase accessory protein CcoG [Steroidobacteraceae bacterium]|nr:cytochrome c oxidase accessory protein CcoG [Steroidobacteraceae bacterium]